MEKDLREVDDMTLYIYIYLDLPFSRYRGTYAAILDNELAGIVALCCAVPCCVVLSCRVALCNVRVERCRMGGFDNASK